MFSKTTLFTKKGGAKFLNNQWLESSSFILKVTLREINYRIVLNGALDQTSHGGNSCFGKHKWTLI